MNELVFLTRSARRFWYLLALGIVLAGALFVHLRKPATSSGIAWTRVALDTPQSQLIKSDGAGQAGESLPWRAQLLAVQMRTAESRAELARQVGLPVDQVEIVNPALLNAPVPAAVPAAAAKAAGIVVAPNVLTISVLNTALPVISVEASAADPKAAKELAAAAVEMLKARSTRAGRYESPVLAAAGKNELEPVDVEPVAPVTSRTIWRDEVPVQAIATAATFLILWCSGVVLVVAPLSRMRRSRRSGTPITA